MKMKILVLTFLGVAIAGAAGVAYWLHSQNLSVQVLSPLATSTPVVITEKPPVPPATASEITYVTSTVGNFQIDHPDTEEVTPRTYILAKKFVVNGNYNLSLPTTNDSWGKTEEVMFLMNNEDYYRTLNPEAKALSDYEQTYPMSVYRTEQFGTKDGIKEMETRREVMILESEQVIVQGIPMLRQKYSLGMWVLNNDGEKSFNARSEPDLENYWRYVFFDGKTFVSVTSKNFEILDRLIQSIRLIK